MATTTQNRWKSKVLWAGIIGGLVISYNAIATAFGLPIVDDAVINAIINGIAGVLALVGIYNNPTDPVNW